MTAHPYRPYRLGTGTSGINPYRPYTGTDTNTNNDSGSLGTDTKETREWVDPNTRTGARSREGAVRSALVHAGVLRNFPGSAEVWLRWAVAVEVWPVLIAMHAKARDIRPGYPARCRAADWSVLLDELLDLNMPDWAYDAAVDLLHDAAAMPCACSDCSIRWADAGLVRQRSAPTRGSVFDAGRYRLRPGF